MSKTHLIITQSLRPASSVVDGGLDSWGGSLAGGVLQQRRFTNTPSEPPAPGLEGSGFGASTGLHWYGWGIELLVARWMQAKPSQASTKAIRKSNYKWILPVAGRRR